MRLITLLLTCFVLTGCAALNTVSDSVAGLTDYFTGGEDNTDPPTELTELTPEIEIDVLWKKTVGDGANGHALKLVPAAGYGAILVADRDGLVQSRDLNSGDLNWEAETEFDFSGGPGLGNGTVVLGTSDAEVVALNLENGELLWTAGVSSEVLSVPAIAQGVVVVRTIDGTVTALDEKNGDRLWSYEQAMPALSVRGTGSLLISGDNVVGGYDNGKLIALRLADGKHVWETSVVIPSGRSEVERLVDLDVDPIETDGVIYIASYQSGIAAALALDGDVIWRNETISSSSGMANDWRYLYLTDSKSDVWQLDQRSGASLWKQKELHQRKLTAPATYESYVVVGDLEGYVHWLSTNDGRQLARVQVADSAMDAKPLVVDNTVYVYAKDGTLAALKARSL
ncbi:outer membrane protein assembly factor BamB [Methylobacter sp. BBA5.1]|uniref:outer membrane protein assembly factor BamB n=1 Tax=Methylobacter sp. BBA5.1 TaxID=1495064 RepID=UPI00068D7C12|nr:outer membrane protein assembly factor BamB [Methylobacter sp. BBA5.1]